MSEADLLAENARLRRRIAEFERRTNDAPWEKPDDCYRNLIEWLPEPVAVHRGGTLVYANPAALRLVGAEHSAQVVGSTLFDWTPAGFHDRVRERMRTLTTPGARVPRLEMVITRLDGTAMAVEFQSIAIDFDGQPSVLVAMRDISGQKRAEARMQLAQQVFDLAGEAIFISDLEGQLLEVNNEACRLAKYSRQEMLHLRNVDIVAQEEVTRIAPQLSACDAGNVLESRWLLLCSDGAKVPLDLVVQRLPDDRYLAIGRDLTEREKALHQLAEARNAAEAASRAKTRFLASASHDLRQPIQAIHLLIGALQRGRLEADQQRIVNFLAQAVSTLDDLLGTLLDISKLDAGAVTPQLRAVRADDLLAGLDGELSPLALEKSLRFKLWFPFNAPRLLTDPKLLSNLLRNLIGNAIKYTTRGGVLIGLRQRGDRALIQVWDSGIGIAEAHRESIFEEYFQVDNPQRDRTRGLGLGLAIVRRLATLLGTEVVCRSQPGRGSVFEFLLPIERAAAGEAAPTHVDAVPSAPAAAFGKQHIVVVEDDEMVARAIRLSLAGAGFAVTVFASAEAALADAATAQADFILSDFRLPGINGVDFLDTVQRRADRPLRAAVMTGDTSPDRIEMTRAANWEVLYKPVELARLLAVIAGK